MTQRTVYVNRARKHTTCTYTCWLIPQEWYACILDPSINPSSCHLFPKHEILNLQLFQKGISKRDNHLGLTSDGLLAGKENRQPKLYSYVVDESSTSVVCHVYHKRENRNFDAFIYNLVMFVKNKLLIIITGRGTTHCVCWCVRQHC